MHELAITQGVVDAIAERLGGARVRVVYLTIGKVSGVDPEAVRFCFDLVAKGTIVEGARLQIDQPAGEARCRDCGAEFRVETPILLCPCGSADVDLRSGQELLIGAVEVA